MPIQRFVGCAPWDPTINNQYGYRPSLTAGIAFCACFATSMLLHIFQAYRKRTWWTLVFAIGALSELMGWAGRTWSHQCPYNLNAFLMQITMLVIAPTFFIAGLYVVLGTLIRLMGRKYSLIGPTTYLWIFCSCDILSLVIQAIGGAMAAEAVNENPPKQSTTGTHIMVGGIVFQMGSITVFAMLFLDFLRRVHKEKQTLGPKIDLLIAATAFSALMIYMRSIYRTIELLQGWSGYLITHQGFFIGLDASLMLLAVCVFNFIHPGWFLPGEKGLVTNADGSDVSEESHIVVQMKSRR